MHLQSCALRTVSSPVRGSSGRHSLVRVERHRCGKKEVVEQNSSIGSVAPPTTDIRRRRATAHRPAPTGADIEVMVLGLKHEDHTHKSDRGTGPRRHRCFLTRHQPGDPWHPQWSAEVSRTALVSGIIVIATARTSSGSGCGTQDMQANLVGSQRCRAAADCHRNDNHEADQVLEQHVYRRRRELTCSFAQSAHQRDAEERQCGETAPTAKFSGLCRCQ